MLEMDPKNKGAPSETSLETRKCAVFRISSRLALFALQLLRSGVSLAAKKNWDEHTVTMVEPSVQSCVLWWSGLVSPCTTVEYGRGKISAVPVSKLNRRPLWYRFWEVPTHAWGPSLLPYTQQIWISLNNSSGKSTGPLSRRSNIPKVRVRVTVSRVRFMVSRITVCTL